VLWHNEICYLPEGIYRWRDAEVNSRWSLRTARNNFLVCGAGNSRARLCHIAQKPKLFCVQDEIREQKQPTVIGRGLF
jgi:hypothetical protein